MMQARPERRVDYGRAAEVMKKGPGPSLPPECEQVRVFVLLGHGFGADRWRERHARGEIAGLNEPFPFGYFRAAGCGWTIEHSRDADEGPITAFVRRCITRALGFDIIHAWRNRHKLFGADVVWTHSERDHLAALLLRQLRAPRRGPKIIAECIWLPDRWESFSPPKRALYRWLLRRADALSSQSQEGVKPLRQLLPAATIEWIPGGAKLSFMRPPARRPAGGPVRIAALGGDMHRDWETLLSAFAGVEGFDLRIAPSKAKIRLGNGMTNVTVARARSEAEVRALDDWADIVVMPLKPNLHASGITVIFEAVVLGIPIVCTDAGGLRDYFPGGEICLVPPGDPRALREAVRALAGDLERRLAMTVAAQRRVVSAGLTTQGYANGFRDLSTLLLAPRTAAAPCLAGAGAVLATRSDNDRRRAFVLLPHGFGAEQWRRRFARREIPGLNDALPFGYDRAASQGWSVVYSEDADESFVTRFVRRGLGRVLGLDLIHAWRNRRALLTVDAVWTHAERENLAAIALFHLVRPRSRPRIVAQCVWLFDRWNGFSWPRRAAYRWLLKEADVVTTLSPENREAARRIIPEIPTELVLFGVGSQDRMRAPRRRVCHVPMRIGALGGDVHRDWGYSCELLAGSRIRIENCVQQGKPPRSEGRHKRDDRGGAVGRGGDGICTIGRTSWWFHSSPISTPPELRSSWRRWRAVRRWSPAMWAGYGRTFRTRKCATCRSAIWRRSGRRRRSSPRTPSVAFRWPSRRNGACLRQRSPGRGTPPAIVRSARRCWA